MSVIFSSRRAAVCLLAAAVALVSFSIPTFAETPAQKAQPQQVVGRAASGSRAAIARYWTKERMRNAKPLDIVVDSKRHAQAAAGAEPDGSPGRVSEIAPTSGASITGASATKAGRTSSGPYPYSRYEITDPQPYPYSASGKVFFKMGTGNYVCSATAVASENKSAVITAGHCVNDGAGGPWATNWAFAPAYRNGVAPYGVWTADSLHTTTEWLTQANLRYDIGGAIIRPNSSGQLLVDVVGGRGIAWNQSPVQFFRSFGYPAGAPFDGSKLYVCDANYGTSDNVPGSGPQPIGIGCDMTGGSSGGGWVIQDSDVNSVNSYKIVGQNEVMYGPYFGDAAETLYNAVRGASVTPDPSPSPAPSPSPSPSPSPDPTPTPPPTPEEPTTHKVTVGLTLVRKLVAKGTITAVDGYKPCTRNALIKVQRRAGGRWKNLARVYTNDFGRYRAKVPNKPGRYRVVSPKGKVDDLNLCSAAKSPVRRAR